MLMRNLVLLSCLLPMVANALTILPETVTPVTLSNRDINRIVCTTGDINDVYYSAEKGIKVSNEGANSFVKFLIKHDGQKEQYVSVRSELYLVCNHQVYTLMVEPKAISGQTVRLGGGVANQMRTNIKRFGALPQESRAIALTKAAFKDDIPDSFTVNVTEGIKRAWQKSSINGMSYLKHRVIIMEGLGFKLTEFWVKATGKKYLQERDFLKTIFGKNIFAVTLGVDVLEKGQVGRVFIVEKERS